MGAKEIQLKLDFRSGIPIYIQIMEQIRTMLENGELNPGDQLPTVRQMAADLRVNFNTVARAYRLLDEAGLISTQLGRGTYIWDAGSSEDRSDARPPDLINLTRQYLAEAARQGFKPDEVADIVWRQLSAWEKSGQPGETSPGEK